MKLYINHKHIIDSTIEGVLESTAPFVGESQSYSNNLKTITKLVNTTVKKCSEYQLPVEKKEISEFQLRTKLVCQMTVWSSIRRKYWILNRMQQGDKQSLPLLWSQ